MDGRMQARTGVTFNAPPPFIKILNVIIAVRTLCARCENAVCTLCAHREHAVATVMDAVKTLWERHVDAVGMLLGLCVNTITGKFDIFRRISLRSHSTLT